MSRIRGPAAPGLPFRGAEFRQQIPRPRKTTTYHPDERFCNAPCIGTSRFGLIVSLVTRGEPTCSPQYSTSHTYKYTKKGNRGRAVLTCAMMKDTPRITIARVVGKSTESTRRSRECDDAVLSTNYIAEEIVCS